MGTNYELRTNPCPHCGRTDAPLHIGKSTWKGDAGLAFIFQGGTWPCSTAEMRCWEDWKALILTTGAAVFDEYGERCDAAEFVAKVENTSQTARRAVADEQADAWDTIHMTGLEWVDRDGFWFTEVEFR